MVLPANTKPVFSLQTWRLNKTQCGTVIPERGEQTGEPAAPARSAWKRFLSCGAKRRARIQDRRPMEASEQGYEHKEAEMAQIPEF